MVRCLWLPVCVSLVALTWSWPTAQAAELRPSWTCLGDDTVMIVRLPGPAAFLDALRARTKLGAVVLHPDRLEQILALIREETPDEWQKFTSGLEKVGLAPKDLLTMYSGELGYAVSLHTGDEIVPVGLAWLEPGEDLAPRLLDAIKQALELQEEDQPKIERFDLEIAGHDVLRLSCPNMQYEYDDETSKVASHESGRVQVLLARIDGRLLLAHTYPSDHMPATDENGVPAQIDPDAGLDACTEIFGRFLEAHGGDGGSTIKLLDVPGMAEALPAGVPLIEVMFDPDPLFELADDADDPMIGRVLEAVGVADAGAAAFRVVLDGSVLRTGFFLSLPAPRKGLMTLLDQPPLEPEPPAWLPVDIMQYNQLSFDLGKAYTQIKQLASTEGGDQAAAAFAFAEAQVQATVQADLASLLSSLGNRHVIVTLPELNQPAGDDAHALPSRRMALAWQLKDEPLWNRLLPILAAMGGVEVVEEQGFHGIRFPDDRMVSGGAFVGQGHLIVGLGKDVVEKMLAALRHPPQDSLRASSLMTRARELMKVEPGLTFSLTNGEQSMQSMVNSFKRTMEFAEKHRDEMHDDPEEAARQKRIADRLKALLPTEQELQGVLGVDVGQSQMTEQGIMHRSAADLPPAD